MKIRNLEGNLLATKIFIIFSKVSKIPAMVTTSMTMTLITSPKTKGEVQIPYSLFLGRGKPQKARNDHLPISEFEE